MFPLIETIRIFNGVANNLVYHQHRMQKAFDDLSPDYPVPDLAQLIADQTPKKNGLFKLRVTYDERQCHIDVEPYQPKSITSLKLVHVDDIQYNHKYQDRSVFDTLLSMKGDCDDVVIARDNYVTDASYANLVFKRGQEWVTPARCLLEGTQRSFLLDAGIIREELISVDDLQTFSHCRLINAMLLNNGPEIVIQQIHF